jgi:spoIIIJ-associated protein
MAENMQEIEVHGETVEEAINSGLQQLGIGRDAAEIEILDEGSSGFLGLGGRDAVVRVSIKETGGTAAAEEKAAIEVEVGHPEEEVTAEPVQEVLEEAAAPEKGAMDEEERSVAMEVVTNLLEKMYIEATTSTRLTEPDERTGEQRLVIDIHGEDMGVLIGPRGDTLNSFQYVARLMTGHTLLRRPGFIIDVEGYRERREKALARLAERMANKAVGRGKPISLEPMPPNERRIIHITLRDDDRVYTESSGEGPRRRVRIYPK